MSVVFIPGGLVGWRLLNGVPPEAEEETNEEPGNEGPAVEEGIGLALRNDGDEILFGARAEQGCVWIPVGEFVVEPALIPEYEYEEDGKPSKGKDGLNESPPLPPPGLGVRRRGR